MQKKETAKDKSGSESESTQSNSQNSEKLLNENQSDLREKKESKNTIKYESQSPFLKEETQKSLKIFPPGDNQSICDVSIERSSNQIHDDKFENASQFLFNVEEPAEKKRLTKQIQELQEDSSKNNESKSIFDEEIIKKCHELLGYLNEFLEYETADWEEIISQVFEELNKLQNQKYDIDPQSLTKFCVLSTGLDATVEKWIDSRNDKAYALRIITNNRISLKTILPELLIYLELIIQAKSDLILIYNIRYENKRLSFLMEYGIGDLRTFLVFLKQNSLELTTENKYFILNQVINQVSLLRSLRIYQRDIKPENIIISKSFDLKLTDFGFAKKLNQFESEFGKFNPCGTPMYLCPELKNAFENKEKVVDLNLWSADLYSIWRISKLDLEIEISESDLAQPQPKGEIVSPDIVNQYREKYEKYDLASNILQTMDKKEALNLNRYKTNSIENFFNNQSIIPKQSNQQTFKSILESGAQKIYEKNLMKTPDQNYINYLIDMSSKLPGLLSKKNQEGNINAEWLSNLCKASILYMQKQYHEALPLIHDAKEILLNQNLGDNIFTKTAFFIEGDCLCETGKIKEGLQNLETSLEIVKRSKGEGSLDLVEIYDTLASKIIQFEESRLADALKYELSSLEIKSKQFDKYHYQLCITYSLLSIIYMKLKLLPESFSYLREYLTAVFDHKNVLNEKILTEIKSEIDKIDDGPSKNDFNEGIGQLIDYYICSGKNDIYCQIMMRIFDIYN